jgi:hypothetical protein
VERGASLLLEVSFRVMSYVLADSGCVVRHPTSTPEPYSTAVLCFINLRRQLISTSMFVTLLSGEETSLPLLSQGGWLLDFASMSELPMIRRMSKRAVAAGIVGGSRCHSVAPDSSSKP